MVYERGVPGVGAPPFFYGVFSCRLFILPVSYYQTFGSNNLKKFLVLFCKIISNCSSY